MTNFKATARTRLCTPLDVRATSDLLKQTILGQKQDEERVLVTDADIDLEIIKRSGLVMDALTKVVGTVPSGLQVTPYFGSPVVNYMNVRGLDEEAPKLTGVTVGASAVTELWTIRFTSDTAFRVRGSVSGVQTATGAVGSNYTSDTDDDLVIPTGAWEIQDTGFDEGDFVYVPTYHVYPTVVQITSYLTAGDILDRLLSEHSPEMSKHGASLYKKGMDWLKMLQSGDMSLGDSSSVPPVEFQEMRYDVTLLGDDVTDYPDSEDTQGRRRVKDAFDQTVE